MLRGVKRVLALPKIFRFDPQIFSSIKLLACKTEKMFPLTRVRFYPSRSCHHQCRVRMYQVRQLRRLHRTNICVSSKKSCKNISNTSCTRNGDHLGLLIKHSKSKNVVANYHSYFLKLWKGGSET